MNASEARKVSSGNEDRLVDLKAVDAMVSLASSEIGVAARGGHRKATLSIQSAGPDVRGAVFDRLRQQGYRVFEDKSLGVFKAAW